MGWRPADVYRTTVPDFWAAWLGWTRFHAAPAKPDPMTRRELDDLLRKHAPNGILP
jgi:hypothetical protein